MSARILVVEDNSSNMTLFRWMLEDAGYLFEGVERAEDGLALLEHEDFDLILMDVSLPGIDGLEATRRRRQNPAHTDLPVIAVTAHLMTSQSSVVLDAGINELVPKPVDETVLLASIERHLKAA